MNASMNKLQPLLVISNTNFDKSSFLTWSTIHIWEVARSVRSVVHLGTTRRLSSLPGQTKTVDFHYANVFILFYSSIKSHFFGKHCVYTRNSPQKNSLFLVSPLIQCLANQSFQFPSKIKCCVQEHWYPSNSGQKKSLQNWT